jgi:hypothetical protein
MNIFLFRSAKQRSRTSVVVTKERSLSLLVAVYRRQQKKYKLKNLLAEQFKMPVNDAITILRFTF